MSLKCDFHEDASRCEGTVMEVRFNMIRIKCRTVEKDTSFTRHLCVSASAIARKRMGDIVKEDPE